MVTSHILCCTEALCLTAVKDTQDDCVHIGGGANISVVV